MENMRYGKINLLNNYVLFIFVLLLNSVYANNIHLLNKHYFGQSSLKTELSSTEVMPFYFMEQQEEIWKDVIDYEGLYQVSDIGNIKSLDRSIICKNGATILKKSKPLKYHISPYGYCTIMLYNNIGIPKGFMVHRLVMYSFVGYSDLSVNHKDFNKQNNALYNLEYLTINDNKIHYFLSKKYKTTSKFIGVQITKSGKWVSTISINNKKIHLGTFDCEYSAHQEYIKCKMPDYVFPLLNKKTSIHKYIGFKKPENKWRLRIPIHNKSQFVSYHKTEHDAILAKEDYFKKLNK